MIVKTTGILLRHAPVSNSSRLTTWLTPDRGKAAALIKGSQRPKSFFLGQYDLFYTCEILLYARDRRHVSVARECYPLKTRSRLRNDWRAAALASYFADLTARICPVDAPHPGLYALLDESLDELDARGAGGPFLFWFELKLLEEMGFSPRLEQCLSCNTSLSPDARGSHFAYARGGILCSRCTEQAREKAVPIAPDVLATLKGWQKARNARAAHSTHSTPRQLEEVEMLLGQFLTYHLETPLDSRALALDLLNRQPGGSAVIS